MFLFKSVHSCKVHSSLLVLCISMWLSSHDLQVLIKQTWVDNFLKVTFWWVSWSCVFVFLALQNLLLASILFWTGATRNKSINFVAYCLSFCFQFFSVNDFWDHLRPIHLHIWTTAISFSKCVIVVVIIATPSVVISVKLTAPLDTLSLLQYVGW